MINESLGSFGEIAPTYVNLALGSSYYSRNPSSFPIIPSLYDFQEAITYCNQKLIERVQNLFAIAIPELKERSDVVITCVGSDGRYEKVGIDSPVELLVVFATSFSEDDPLIQKIQKLVQENGSLFDKRIEKKRLDSDNLLLCTLLEKSLASPSRTLDALYLAGSTALLTNYKKRAFAQIQTQNEEVKNFRKNALGSAKAALRKVQQKSSNAVNLQTGELFYNGNSVKGVKYPLLRMVHFTLADEICKAIQRGIVSEEEFLLLPRTSIERICWLKEKGILNISDVQERALQQGFMNTLAVFAIEQERYHGAPDTLSIDATKLLQECIVPIQQFLNK